MRDDPICKLRGKNETMAYILSRCRYRWRRDKVFAKLADILEQARTRKHWLAGRQAATCCHICQGGSEAGRAQQNQAKSPAVGPSVGAKGRPAEKAPIPVCCPHNFMSRCSPLLQGRNCVLVELTVPREERSEEASERKSEHRTVESQLCPVEVRSRDFPAQSSWKLLTAVGPTGSERGGRNEDWGRRQIGWMTGVEGRRPAGSQEGVSSGWPTTADPPAGGCYRQGLKPPMSVGNYLMTQTPG